MSIAHLECYRPSGVIVAIAAMNDDRVIGRNGQLPWDQPLDRRFFAECTRGHTVLLGRPTYQSIPSSYRPLPGRVNVVASRRHSEALPAGVEQTDDVLGFVRRWRERSDGAVLWVAGGEEIFSITMQWWDEVVISRIPGSHPGDRWMPPFEGQFDLALTLEQPGFRVQVYRAPRG